MTDSNPDLPPKVSAAEQKFRTFLTSQDYANASCWLTSDDVIAHANRPYWVRKRAAKARRYAVPRYSECLKRCLGFSQQPIRSRSLLLFAILLSPPALAQQVAPAIPSTGFTGLDQYRASRVAIYTDDFGQLARYRKANTALAPPAAGENRVVFLGDSITDYWKLSDYFPGKPYINRGIDGQSTPEMLVRFRQDVIDLHPKVVVVLAGTNDIAGVTGPTSNQDIEANYASMAELARAHGIQMVFASVLPVHNYTADAKESFALRPRERILALNEWLKDYCTKNGLVYLDYFSALVDERGMLKHALAEDGLHPTDAGYKIMAPLAEKAIQGALAENRLR